MSDPCRRPLNGSRILKNKKLTNTTVVVQVQLTTLCVSVTLSATVALVCLFGPKLHIIAFQTHKNVRKLTMTTGASGGRAATGTEAPKKSQSSIASSEMAAAGAGGAGPVGRARLFGSADSQKRPSDTSRSGCFIVRFSSI